ncbi:MAG: oligosaccharide flippase family protein [Catalinimonas sp.]
MGTLRRLMSDTVLYGLSSIVGRAVNFLLVPLYTALFDPAAYGIVAELYGYVAFLNVVFTYGMETAYFRFATKDPDHRRRAYDDALSLLLLTTVALTVLLVGLAPTLARVLAYPDKAHYLVWLALTVGIDAAVALPFARLRLEGKAMKFAMTRLVNILANIGFNLFFLYFCRWVYDGELLPALRPVIDAVYDPTLGVGYVFLSNLLANALFVVLLRRELFDFRWRFDRVRLGPLFRYAYPLLFAGLAGIANETLDRPLLRWHLPDDFYPGQTPLDAVGVYSGCYKLAVIVNLGIQAFRYAAEPFFFARAADRQSPALFARVMHWFVIVGTFTFLGISLNLEWIAPLVLRRAEYLAGVGMVPILLLAYVFAGVYLNLSIWYKLTDRTHWGTILLALGAAVTVGVNLLLIPVLGYWGSALATLLCYVTMSVVCYVAGQRHFPIPYQLGWGLVYLLLGVALVTFDAWLVVESPWLRWALRAGWVGLFVGVVLVRERPLRRAVAS